MVVSPRIISLFSGGGGIHLGFVQAGFEPVFATDIEPVAAKTFALNSPDTPFFLGDIRHLTPAQVSEYVGNQPVDIVVGGPPCQGFSTLGDQLQGDPRNSLFEAFARIIRWVRPSCVLMENTSYLRTQYSGRYETEIKQTLESLGYRVFVKTLNAAEFGVPQIRKRVFFFATKLPSDFAWPVVSHGDARLPYVTVGESIMDLADLCEAQGASNHLPLKHSDVVVARYKMIPEGGRLPPPQELPAEIRRRNFGNTYKRLHRSQPSLTLVPGNNAFPVHPTEHRSLTPREAARIQTFPDTYVFAGTRAQQCKLVGNAVPVLLAKHLAEAALQHILVTQVATTLETDGAKVFQQLNLAIGEVPAPKTVSKKAGKCLTSVSFFTGAGGLMLGFLRAGFAVTASYDRKAIVSKNAAINFPDVSHFHRDIEETSVTEVLRDIGYRKPDVVFGGSPCQGFSIFGKRRFVHTQGHVPQDDPRNVLTLRFIDIAVGLEPKAIMLENVKGMVSTPFSATRTYLEEVTSRLKDHGYQVQYRVVNCADYGVPQARERLLLVATLDGIEFQWPVAKYHEKPKAWQRPYVTVGDVISDLADPSTYDVSLNHVPMNHGELLVRRYELIPEGGRLPEADLPADLKKGQRSDNIKNFSHVYRRLDRKRPATTMVPGHNAFPIHPTLPRALTVREAARIQTFPDSMRFVGTRQQQCMLVGNAVPPILAELIAQSIMKSIKGNAKSPGYKADHYELKAQERFLEIVGG